MAVWRTGVVHFMDNEANGTYERIDVEFSTDVELSHDTTVEFQKLAWQAVRKAKPEWKVPETHVKGFVKTGTAPHGTLTMLSHEYREV
jgi:hypothetical protein